MRRLKIISSANLKLIISFLIYSYHYFHPSSRYHLLPWLGMLHLTSRVYLRLASRPSAQFWNSSIQEWLQAQGTTLKCQGPVLTFLQAKHKYKSRGVSVGRTTSKKCHQNVFLQFPQREKQTKLRLTSYILGPVFNGSSMKCRVLHSRNSSSQRQRCGACIRGTKTLKIFGWPITSCFTLLLIKPMLNRNQLFKC